MSDTSSSSFKFPFRGLNADAFTNLLPNTDAVSSFARDTVEASTASTRASVKGMQDAGQTLFGIFKEQASLSVETGKKLVSAKSLQDAVNIQTEFVKSSFDNNVRGLNNLADVYTDTFVEAVTPLANQARKVAEAA